MAKTPRYTAAPFLIVLLLVLFVARVPAMEMTAVDLVTTSGTLEIQRVKADNAILSDDGTHIDAKDLTLSLNLSADRHVSAIAPQGVIVVGGEEKKNRDTNGKANAAFKQLLEYGNNFSSLSGPGDLLLDGKGNDTVAKIGTDGEIAAGKLIWSDRMGQFLFPGQFHQQGSVGQDFKVHVTGAAVSIDQQFRNWTYYGDEKSPAVIVWERNADSTQATNPKDGKSK